MIQPSLNIGAVIALPDGFTEAVQRHMPRAVVEPTATVAHSSGGWTIEARINGRRYVVRERFDVDAAVQDLARLAAR